MVASAPVAPRSRPERLHLGHVEGLRALAALTVYVNHAYAQAWREPIEHPTGPLYFFRYFMVTGHLAVSVFIVISGFCLALPVVDAGDVIRRGNPEFFKRRARRILPPYYGALAFSLLLIYTIIGEKTGSLWDIPIAVDWQTIVAHVVMVQDFFRTGRINYVFWSIAVEWHIYFLFPLFVWGVRRFGILRVVPAALAAGYALRLACAGTRVDRANVHFLGLFALGMLAAYVCRSPKPALRALRHSNAWAWIAAAMLLFTVALFVWWDVPLAVERFAFLDLTVGIMAMAALIHTSLDTGRRLTRFLQLRPLVFVGTFSYSVYLVHAPLLQVIWQYVLVPLDTPQPVMLAALLTAGLGLILAFSYLFHLLCERPFMSTRARTSAKVAEARAVTAA